MIRLREGLFGKGYALACAVVGGIANNLLCDGSTIFKSPEGDGWADR